MLAWENYRLGAEQFAIIEEWTTLCIDEYIRIYEPFLNMYSMNEVQQLNQLSIDSLLFPL